MKIENKIDIQNIIFSQNPNYNNYKEFLKKEIIYDVDKDKYYLYDKENHKKFRTNFFGKLIPKINNKLVGKEDYDERIKNRSVEEIMCNIDDSLYHPRTKNFDGFSQIPRPLIPPFSNNILLKSKNDILNYIKNKESFISIQKNKNLFDKTENIPDLDYYSGTIASNITNNKKNKNIVLKKIIDALNSGNLNKKEIDSLQKFRHNLLNNSANIINGKELNKPKDVFLKQYNINYNAMFINPIKNLSKN